MVTLHSQVTVCNFPRMVVFFVTTQDEYLPFSMRKIVDLLKFREAYKTAISESSP